MARTLSDSLFARAVERFDELALLEMAAVVGFHHHLVSFLVRTARVEDEPWAAAPPAAHS